MGLPHHLTQRSNGARRKLCIVSLEFPAGAAAGTPAAAIDCVPGITGGSGTRGVNYVLCPWNSRTMKTLKHEEVDGRAYRDIKQARSQIGAFIEQVYNRHRLHSALGYRPPAEFEANLQALGTAAQQPLRLQSATCP